MSTGAWDFLVACLLFPVWLFGVYCGFHWSRRP